MAEILTPEKFKSMLSIACAGNVSGEVPHWKAKKVIIAHDAALRAALSKCEEDHDAELEKRVHAERERDDAQEAFTETKEALTTAEIRLTACEQECDNAKDAHATTEAQFTSCERERATWEAAARKAEAALADAVKLLGGFPDENHAACVESDRANTEERRATKAEADARVVRAHLDASRQFVLTQSTRAEKAEADLAVATKKLQKLGQDYERVCRCLKAAEEQTVEAFNEADRKSSGWDEANKRAKKAEAELAALNKSFNEAQRAAWYAFVEGAKWFSFYGPTGATMFPSERRAAEEEARKRYPYIPHPVVEVLKAELAAALAAQAKAEKQAQSDAEQAYALRGYVDLYHQANAEADRLETVLSMERTITKSACDEIRQLRIALADKEGK